jgi:hypothetical protein
MTAAELDGGAEGVKVNVAVIAAASWAWCGSGGVLLQRRYAATPMRSRIREAGEARPAWPAEKRRSRRRQRAREPGTVLIDFRVEQETAVPDGACRPSGRDDSASPAAAERACRTADQI